MQIELKEANSQLNHVVVVDHGTQSKKSLIGAVFSVKASDMNNKPAASFDQRYKYPEKKFICIKWDNDV